MWSTKSIKMQSTKVVVALGKINEENENFLLNYKMKIDWKQIGPWNESEIEKF